MVGDVPEGTADGALEHEAAKASGVVATVDGGFHCVDDRIHHRIHGRYRVCHLLPWETATPAKSSVSFPANSLSFLFCLSASAVKGVDNVLEEKVSIDENACLY